MHTVHNLEMACWDILEPKYIISITQKKNKKNQIINCNGIDNFVIVQSSSLSFFFFVFPIFM